MHTYIHTRTVAFNTRARIESPSCPNTYFRCTHIYRRIYTYIYTWGKLPSGTASTIKTQSHGLPAYLLRMLTGRLALQVALEVAMYRHCYSFRIGAGTPSSISKMVSPCEVAASAVSCFTFTPGSLTALCMSVHAGPWRGLSIKRGLDPRKEPECRRWQLLTCRFPEGWEELPGGAALLERARAHRAKAPMNDQTRNSAEAPAETTDPLVILQSLPEPDIVEVSRCVTYSGLPSCQNTKH
jgi:hypothetical protein